MPVNRTGPAVPAFDDHAPSAASDPRTKAASPRRRGSFHPLLVRAAARHRRGDAVGPNFGAHHGALRRAGASRFGGRAGARNRTGDGGAGRTWDRSGAPHPGGVQSAVLRLVARDRKSTLLNSSHGYISYAVFCLKKKKRKT